MMKKLLLSLSLPLLFLNASIAEEVITEATETVYATPLQAVLADNPFTENDLSTLSLSQELNRGENADKVMITLIESGLLDDSIFATKNVYFIKRGEQGWSVDEKFKTQKCRRGEDTSSFISANCP